ncbi:MAG: DUF6261 family protein [Mariniphaga sp.]
MINAIDLAKLRNGEFLQFGTNFSGLVETNNPKGLNVEPQHLVFKTKIGEMGELFNREKASPLTQELILLDERRDRAIIGISAVIAGYCSHFLADIAAAATLLTNDLQLFGTGVARQNFQSETALIGGIVKDWETKTDLTAALAKLGLNEWAAELKTANTLFDQKYIERTKEYGSANPDTLKAKREETMTAYYELRKYLDAWATIQNTPEYQKAISQLNALIDLYNQLLTSRIKEAVTPPVVNKPE